MYIPHFQEPQEVAGRGFLVEVHVNMISCQIATLQIYHMLIHPEYEATPDASTDNYTVVNF